MAIAKVKKVEIIGLGEDRDRLIERLQQLAILELIAAEKPPALSLAPSDTLPANLLEIEEAISLLANYRQEKNRGLAALIFPKPIFYRQQAKELLERFDYHALLKELAGLRAKQKNIALQHEHLLEEYQLLTPWQNLNLSLNQLHSTRDCGIFLGLLNLRDYNKLSTECANAGIDIFCDTVYQDRAHVYLAILYFKEALEPLEAMLKAHNFNFVSLTRHNLSVRQRLSEIAKQLKILDTEAEKIKEQIAILSKDRLALMVVYDYLSNAKKRQEVRQDILQQKFSFILSGWILAKDLKQLEKTLKNEFPETALFVSEPEGNDIPIDLENHKMLEPFEFITKIYGLPQYGELDPTPFLAAFFFIYFGFCVSDAGYGLLILAVAFFALKKIHLGPNGKRFFKLFLYCGVSTVAVGIATGSYFGNLFDLASEYNTAFLPLKKFKDTLIILDPLKEPTKLLVIALCLGIFQVWFGNIVAAIGNFKNRRYLDILFDQVSMLILLFGLTGVGLVFLNAISPYRLALFQYITLTGSVALLLTQGRAEKGLGAKIFFGAYNLYNSLSGYLSDILSYSRLWALGLVTGVMANTINLISVQFSQIFSAIIPGIEKLGPLKIILATLILCVVFIVGHTVSFLMNLLGAFVHPLRLQFVEFFSKFFKSGGRPFKPLKVESKYVSLE